MKRIVTFVKKWFFIPLLPFLTIWMATALEEWSLGESVAAIIRDTPTREYVADINRSLAAAVLSIILVLYESLLGVLDDRHKVEVKVRFQPADGFSDQTYIGRLEENSTLITLVVETRSPSRTARWLLHLLVPDLAVEVSWTKDWLRITTDTPSPLTTHRLPEEDACRVGLFEILGQQGKGADEFPLYIMPTTNRRREGPLSCRLSSKHRVGLFLAGLLLLKERLSPIQLYLRPAPAGQGSAWGEPDLDEPSGIVFIPEQP